jgi:hypothetical protein
MDYLPRWDILRKKSFLFQLYTVILNATGRREKAQKTSIASSQLNFSCYSYFHTLVVKHLLEQLDKHLFLITLFCTFLYCSALF